MPSPKAGSFFGFDELVRVPSDYLDAAPPGTGLTNMRDRIAACGGTLRVESVPGEGTRIHACIPATSGAARDLPVR